MAYSKAYQTVIAGRVREDEAIAFYGKNEIALPPRVTSFNSMGGQKQPTLAYQPNEFVGKNVTITGVTDTKNNIGAYNPPAIQLS